MCGIVGLYGDTDESLLLEMLQSIEHRGPDDEGTHVDPDGPVMHGARRLSIVDLADGHQPMTNEDGTVTVTYNGEIYNHRELRADLEAEGHTFETQCDTEVLVHLWEEYGEAMPEKLDGMFAFTIWDETEECVFLARDRLGIKPLFLAETDERIVWGSEVRPLLIAGVPAAVDPTAVYNFFSLRYTPWPQTLLSRVEKVPPGTSVQISADGRSQRQYWQPTYDRVTASRSSIVDRIRQLLERSVERRMMADVPVGTFLSGGLDSSAIAGIIADNHDGDLDTFSIAFSNEDYDESNEARFVADHLGTNHHEVEVDLSSMETFGRVVRHYGEPIADPAILPTLLLADYASDYVKTVLTGEGADELFCGYYYYSTWYERKRRRNMFPDRLYDGLYRLGHRFIPDDRLQRYAEAVRTNEDLVLGVARRFCEPPEQYLTVEETPETSSLAGRIDNLTAGLPDEFPALQVGYDVTYWLPDDLLYKVDHATMANSLEARVPYLGHDLVEFLYSVPSKHKLSGGYKPLLSAAVADIVPERTRERSKHGFNVPVDEWFRTDQEAIAGWLTEEHIDLVPYLRSDAVFDIWSAHRDGEDRGELLWKCLSYVAWYHEFVKPYR